MQKPDPLGIDWSTLPPQVAKVAKPPAIFHQADIVYAPALLREPDAIVLILRRMTCLVCHSVSEAPEENLFTRTGGRFSQTRQSIDAFAGVRRETKIIHLSATFCGNCFKVKAP
jgi:hypothetical protein